MSITMLAAAEGAENSFILPHDINEVIWGSSAFLIVVGIILWKAGPAIKKAWNDRIANIETEVTQAEAGRLEAERSLAEVRQRIADVDQERSRIRTEAVQTATSLQQQIAERATQDAAAARARGVADVAATEAQATSDLQAEMTQLAVGAIEAVVSRNLDDATQADLIESYIATVGTREVSA